jgi:hypothetical protein
MWPSVSTFSHIPWCCSTHRTVCDAVSNSYIRSTFIKRSGTLIQVNNTMISVFQRKRPRGDWMNVKMTGMVGESPVGFVKGACLCVL